MNAYNEKNKIHFVYTKAYDCEQNNIEGIKKKLLEINYFKNNQNEFHYIDIISKKN